LALEKSSWKRQVSSRKRAQGSQSGKAATKAGNQESGNKISARGATKIEESLTEKGNWGNFLPDFSPAPLDFAKQAKL
jgi:hypothetical protein